MSVSQARAQGERVAELNGGGKVPIDVLGIAERFGIRVEEVHLGADVSGVLVTGGRDLCIGVQRADSYVRKRFTIAHEIGHFVLRHQFKSGGHVHVDRGHLISQRNMRSSEGVDPVEIEANQFAACLLMPSRLLRSAVAMFAGPLRDHHVEDLAKKFGVSEQAMTIRLTTLRLL